MKYSLFLNYGTCNIMKTWHIYQKGKTQASVFGETMFSRSVLVTHDNEKR